MTDTESGRPIHAGEDAAALVDRMVDRLGLWETRTDAALFLASLAVYEDADPVPDDEIGTTVEVGDLSSAIHGIDEVGELALFEVVGEQDTLAAVLDENLTGLVEAGARLLDERLDRSDPHQAVSAVVEIVDASAT
jgi:hypothetical protein